MTTQLASPVTPFLYEHDYQQWLETTVKLLRDRSFELLDLDNLIEEIEEMGKSSKREVFNRLVVLLIHLLKGKYQPARQSNSWLSTINEQRRQLFILFRDSPSLHKSYLPTIFDESYQMACKLAAKETNLPLATFPESCPFTEIEILDFDFLP
ncbi:MAG: DUF29 domain-containing protein [Microcystis panniformis]|uniref:DUF29 domain-containing protein n=1 Tax=Microcystis aeruginosa PCC 9443 TaxID=1160281 RepID=I4FZK3_MICAE|nr:DUF29 domain-containing protein [Microcystis aeruginosa]CCI01114.1 conserved hypothetical protein [Microcystis aeruginosa PCC 9443]